MRFLRDALVTLALLAVGAAVVGFLFTRNGLSARTDPPAIEKAVAERVRWLSIPSAAKRQVNPYASNANAWVEGGKHFQDHCAICHDENGSGKSEIGRNVYPKVPDMRLGDTQGLSDGALYFIIANGVRYTAMPAWADEHTPAEIWQMVSFIRKLPKATPEDLERVMVGDDAKPEK
jgi:mono/diheme cytochrome c family protein